MNNVPRYLHLTVPEIDESLTSSINRHKAISNLPVPSTIQRIKNVLSDQSNIDYPVYRRCQTAGKDGARTVASGNLFLKKIHFALHTLHTLHTKHFVCAGAVENLYKRFFFLFKVYLIFKRWNGQSMSIVQLDQRQQLFFQWIYDFICKENVFKINNSFKLRFLVHGYTF